MAKRALGEPKTDSNLTYIQSSKYNLSHGLDFKLHLGRQPLLLTTMQCKQATMLT